MHLTRHPKNPLLAPTENWWETKAVFNPGVATYRNKTYLLYRAIGNDHTSRLGLAVSDDGIHFTRSKKPLIEGEQDDKYARLGVEDPRITEIAGKYYIVFTEASVYSCKHTGTFAPSVSATAPWRIRMSCVSTENFKSFRHEAMILPRTDSKDGVLFPEKIDNHYVLIHRIYPNMYITTASNLRDFDKGDMVFSPGMVKWARERVGAGGPPLKTKDGWLLFIHGTDDYKNYHLGAMLLELKNPQKILAVTQEPILSPQKPYEKKGLIPNVVFTCGAIERQDQYWVYYAGADKVIGLATVYKEYLMKLLK